MSSSSISIQENNTEADNLDSNVIVVTTSNDENDGEDNGTGLSLREAISLANHTEEADLILFESNLSGSTIKLSQGELEIEDSVTIKNVTGDNIAVDARDDSRIFKIDDGNADNKIDVTLEGLTITGGQLNPGDRSETGGGIVNYESLTISGVNITDNSASEGGGIANFGLLNIYNSRIDNNESSLGGAISNNGVANISHTYINDNAFSAISNTGRLDIIYSDITNNQGDFGGAIVNSGEANVAFTKVDGNTALGDGGAIVNDNGKLTILHSNITNNSAGNEGGGIYNVSGELNLRYSSVSGNTATETGGGISNYRAIANINSSNITNNSAVYDTYAYLVGGGGISVISSSLNLSDSNVSENEAIFGGGIYSDSATVNIDRSLVNENYGGFVGGGLYHNQTELNLSNSVITGNEGSFAFGGIGLSESTGNIDETTISDNIAIDSAGISINTSTGNIANSTISGNIATELDGGGVSVSNATANISNSTISNNSADDNGGGIHNNISSATNLSNSTVSGNSASEGGGIYQRETIFTYDGSAYSGSVNLNSTIVAGNINDDDLGGEDFVNSNGDNLIGNVEGFENSFSEENGDIFGSAENPIDPLLGELQDNGGTTETQELLEGSGAIDSGNNDLNLPTDQRGSSFARTVNGTTDIGAFEVEIFDSFDTSYAGTLDDGNDWIIIEDNSLVITLHDSFGSNVTTMPEITDSIADDFVFSATIT